jgi:hypothetical protein
MNNVDILAGLDTAESFALIDELIGCQRPLLMVLRLLCLICVVQGGIKTKQYDYYKQEILQVNFTQLLPWMLELISEDLNTKNV